MKLIRDHAWEISIDQPLPHTSLSIRSDVIFIRSQCISEARVGGGQSTGHSGIDCFIALS